MKYRLYSLVNTYFSPLQHGLQTAHVTAEIMLRYGRDGVARNWAQLDKTIIILNGGNHKDLNDFYRALIAMNCPHPFALFCEDEESANKSATAVGIILPDLVYAPQNVRRLSKVDRWIYAGISDLPLAGK